MTAKPTQSKGLFSPLVGILTSGAAAVTTVFGLFGAVLKDVAPPIEDSQQTVAFSSLLTVAVLLGLTILIREKLSSTDVRRIFAFALVFFLLALGAFLWLRDDVRTYVYRYPPSSIPHHGQTRHVRGELHERGKALVGTRSISDAVYQAGGPNFVDASGLLWSERSRLDMVSRLERAYVALVLLSTITIFSLGITLWRLTTSRSTPKKKTKAKKEANDF